jgi:hypothetical protein
MGAAPTAAHSHLPLHSPMHTAHPALRYPTSPITMHARGTATVAALALLLCAAEGARLPLAAHATAGAHSAQYDKCTVKPPGTQPSLCPGGTDGYCCRTKLTANKFAGCCNGDPCHQSHWQICCHGIYSIGSSWAKTGTDPKTSTPCHQNAQSVVYVAANGGAPVVAPTQSASQEPRVATIGRVAEPDDTHAAASTPERNAAPTSALGGLFPPGTDPASKPAVLEALQVK